MIGTAPSKGLEKWIVWDLYNIHLKEDAPEWAVKEFEETTVGNSDDEINL